MREANVWDPLAVNQQKFKTANVSAFTLLRIDDIVSGTKKERKAPAGTRFAIEEEGEETVGDQRDG
jgi:chaperonin GroEL (HSP60 family)